MPDLEGREDAGKKKVKSPVQYRESKKSAWAIQSKAIKS